jgi:hypothetical protein
MARFYPQHERRFRLIATFHYEVPKQVAKLVEDYVAQAVVGRSK